MTKQGLMLQGEWRQRLMNGAYSIRAAGIYQLDKDDFLRDDGTPTPGYRDLRGSLETIGPVRAQPEMGLGLGRRAAVRPDLLPGLRPARPISAAPTPFRTGLTEGISQLYLTGRGDRSYFDARTIYYYGFSEADVQNQIPIIHPVIDYNYTFDNPMLGGELGYQRQPDQPVPRQRRVRPDHATRVRRTTCALRPAPTRP